MADSQRLIPANHCRSIPLARYLGASVQSDAAIASIHNHFTLRKPAILKMFHTDGPNTLARSRASTLAGARVRGPVRFLFAFFLLGLLPGQAAFAESTQAGTEQSAQQKGFAIATAADRADYGFGDSTADMTMVMNVANASPIARQMRQLTLEVDGDGDKSILVFDRPRDLKGTAILTHTHRTGPDDQWLYLPALKRVKRISSADKSGPFMGSEFAYEDLASQEVEKYQYRYLREEPCGEERCHLVERVPTDKKSGYSYQVAWFDQSELRLQRVDYFDRKKARLKTMTMVGYHQYLDQFWRPDEMHMINHQTEKSTVLKFANYRFQVGLDDNDFTRNAVSRMR